jgi:transposase InsO family protein
MLHLHLKQGFTRPYTPRTNGKAERFIQTALRVWACARSTRTQQKEKSNSNAGCTTTISTAPMLASN